jgi:hypothetical protein
LAATIPDPVGVGSAPVSGAGSMGRSLSGMGSSVAVMGFHKTALYQKTTVNQLDSGTKASGRGREEKK